MAALSKGVVNDMPTMVEVIVNQFPKLCTACQQLKRYSCVREDDHATILNKNTFSIYVRPYCYPRASEEQEREGSRGDVCNRGHPTQS